MYHISIERQIIRLSNDMNNIIMDKRILLIIKDRQQEARAVLVGSRYIGDYYIILELQYMYYIPLTTLLSGLFIDIKHIKFTGPDTKRA